MSQKFIVSVINPGESAADNGRTIHALKLGKELKEAGADVMLLFQGKGVTWVPRFMERTDDSHPFVVHYGDVFDQVADCVHVCNMCCKRFDVIDFAQQRGLNVHGEASEHIKLAPYLLDGWNLTNF